MPLTAERFVERRRPGWDELERRIASGRGAPRSIATADLEQLGRLYRRAASDLAIARRDFPGEGITDYLNGLVSRAHPLVYRGAPLRPASLVQYFGTTVPRCFRSARWYVLASLGIFLVGVVAAWVTVTVRSDLAGSIVPHTSLFERMARGEIPQGTDTGITAALAIMLNNIKVALIAFALGVLLVPTVWVLLQNGWVLGALGAQIHHDGLDVDFWSYIAPHGVMEISIVVFAAATGLMLADALLRPGLRSRADSLAAVTPAALGMALGTACVLVVCGLLEGYLSPSAAPEPLKYAVGALGGTALYSWLLLGGRGSGAAAPAPSLERTIAEQARLLTPAPGVE